MQFFVVSAGRPGSDYIESNFENFVTSDEFSVFESAKQKGTFYSIEEDDVLILKYNTKFVAYGIVNKRVRNDDKNFSNRIKVQEWIFFNFDNPREGVSRYGIKRATIAGGGYGTVKTVRPNFGLDKIKQINDAHPSYDLILNQFKETSSNLKKDGDYFALHEEIFNFLMDKTESDSDFTFVIRSSNNKSNLDKGYWFYGEKSVALSFWTGMDFSKDRPVISFIIDQNKGCRLVIETVAHEKLKSFLQQDHHFLSLSLNENDGIFSKTYDFETHDYLNCLDSFLKEDYRKINRITEIINDSFDQEIQLIENEVVKFPLKEFEYRLNNLFRFRQRDSPELTLYSSEDDSKGDSLERIRIQNYGLIKNEELNFDNASWVFITGENGSGKTMLLRAIATTLGNRKLTAKELLDSNFKVEANLTSDGRDIELKRVRNEGLIGKRKTITRGLSMYGPYRLEQTSNQVKNETFKKALSPKGSFASLFENASKLLSFDKQLEIWIDESTNKNYIIDSRIREIVNLLPRLIPDLRSVKFKRRKYNKFDFEYLIETEGSDELIGLKWHELSSGNKNILNLVSDIVIRLFKQQPKVIDPSELRGIIIIDEIDLHLHPKAQKDLVITLSETFPLLQFIVSTHSPIPLLGAPENSAIFVVTRDWEKGVYCKRLEKLENEFKYLLPNTLLTSDIFDFDIMEDISKENINKVFLEDNYDDIEKHREVDRRLAQLDKSIFPDDLFQDEN
ncbi:AAA family ATPase [Nonlabens dokdonensis]|uniref:AAA family ATPase n=1 Tax=Nonlabens dokdonensis TaxID=328515 RepID=UPI0026ED4F78|nr:AAA family ATPase [Nonlabens dokdonensis]